MPDIQPMSPARRYLGAGLAQPAGEGVNPSTPAMLVYVRAADGGRRARMLINKLDRTQWRLSQAIDHVATQIERAVVRGEIAQLCDPTAPSWRRAENPRQTAASNAAREIPVTLQDGDLHAQGRLSTERCGPWTNELQGWDLHSGYHTTITPEQWRAGRANLHTGVLTIADGQFIDIRVPRFMVLAIWPVIEVAEPSAAPDPTTGEPYRTPYMDLLDRAIAENRITARPRQEGAAG
jgi:hypothetical protein